MCSAHAEIGVVRCVPGTPGSFLYVAMVMGITGYKRYYNSVLV